jgi:hypothetical protein
MSRQICSHVHPAVHLVSIPHGKKVGRAGGGPQSSARATSLQGALFGFLIFQDLKFKI